MTNQTILSELQNKIDTYPVSVKEVYAKYNISEAPSVKSLASAYALYGNSLLEDFYNATYFKSAKISNATGSGWSTWLSAAGSALTGFASGFTSSQNQDQILQMQIDEQERQAALESQKQTTYMIIGVALIIALVVGGYFFLKK